MPYIVEYCKSGRAMCKKCQGNMGEGTIKFGSGVDMGNFLQVTWKHLRCVSKEQATNILVNYKIDPLTGISGMSRLKPEDQQRVVKRLNDLVNPPPKPPREKKAKEPVIPRQSSKRTAAVAATTNMKKQQSGGGNPKRVKRNPS
jgi:hypothetical protein